MKLKRKSNRNKSIIIALYFFIALIFLFTNIAYAFNNFIKVDPKIEQNKMFKKAYYLEDKSANLTWEEVYITPNSSWKKSDKEFYNFGFVASSFWIRLEFEKSSEKTTKYLRTSNVLQDFIDVYFLDEDGRLIKHYISGDQRLLSVRNIKSRLPTFDLDFPANQTTSVLIKLSSDEKIHEIGNLSLHSREGLKKLQIYENLFFGIYYGACFAIIFINIFLAFFTKDKFYTLYSIYLFLFMAQNLFYTGNAYFYFFGDYPVLNNIFVPIFWFSVIFAIWRLIAYLVDLKNLHAKFTQIVNTVFYLLFATFIYSILTDYRLAIIIILVTTFFAIFSFIVVIIVFSLYTEDKALGKIYFTGSLAFALGVFYYSLSLVNAIESSFLSIYAINIGSAIEFSVISLAVGQRLIDLQKKVNKIRTENQNMLKNRVRDTVLALKRSNMALEQISETDELTELGNRRKFQKDFVEELGSIQNKDKSLGLAILDLDYFKYLNDTYGHQKGDFVLFQVASTLAKELRTSKHKIYRLGGEEFVIILVDTDKKTTKKLLENLCSCIEDLKIENKKSDLNFLTISIGAYIAKNRQDVDYDLLYSSADENLYKAKDIGRNTIILSKHKQENTNKIKQEELRASTT